MTDCNVNELNKELAALEILKELRDDLEAGNLHDNLSNLITQQEAECNRIAGECGKIDLDGILSPEFDERVLENVDIVPGGDATHPSLLPQD